MSMLEALILFLPAGLANAAPVIANRIPIYKRWDAPLDFGKSYGGKRIFGSNKTWRGLVFGTAAGALCGLLIYLLNPHLLEGVRLAPFWPGLEMTVIGAVLGFGALYGDAAESFFKRQLDISPGKSWFPFDQLDFVAGALIASSPLKLFSWTQMAIVVAVYFVLHLVVAFLGYKLKLKSTAI